MSIATEPLGPISVIRSKMPSTSDGQRELLKSSHALEKLSFFVGSKCPKARVNPEAVRLIVQELMEELSQNPNGVRGKGDVGSRRNRKKGIKKPGRKPACRRRSARFTFRS